MIHRIRIQNFKSLRAVTVHLGPVTVFIGRSGTGKTNLASAIRSLRECLLSGPNAQIVQRPFPACRCAAKMLLDGHSAESVAKNLGLSGVSLLCR